MHSTAGDADDVADGLSEYEDVLPSDAKEPDHAAVNDAPVEGSNVDAPDGASAPSVDSKDAAVQEAMKYLKSGEPMPVVMPTVATPEHSHPGESQPNGKVERSIRTFVELFGCLKACLEARLQLPQPLPCAHPVVRWLVKHTSVYLEQSSA